MSNSSNSVTNTGAERQNILLPSGSIIIGGIQGGIIITGIATIDQIIITSCPAILEMTKTEIINLSGQIQDHIFGRDFLNGIIEDRTNADVAEIIESLAIIASVNDIENIEELRDCIESFGADLEAADICKI